MLLLEDTRPTFSFEILYTTSTALLWPQQQDWDCARIEQTGPQIHMDVEQHYLPGLFHSPSWLFETQTHMLAGSELKKQYTLSFHPLDAKTGGRHRSFDVAKTEQLLVPMMLNFDLQDMS